MIALAFLLQLLRAYISTSELEASRAFGNELYLNILDFIGILRGHKSMNYIMESKNNQNSTVARKYPEMR